MPDREWDEGLMKDIPKWLEEDYQFTSIEVEETITFKCKDCKGIDDVPEFVVSEFSIDKKKGEEVEIHCPHCGGTMIRAKKSPE